MNAYQHRKNCSAHILSQCGHFLGAASLVRCAQACRSLLSLKTLVYIEGTNLSQANWMEILILTLLRLPILNRKYCVNFCFSKAPTALKVQFSSELGPAEYPKGKGKDVFFGFRARPVVELDALKLDEFQLKDPFAVTYAVQGDIQLRSRTFV